MSKKTVAFNTPAKDGRRANAPQPGEGGGLPISWGGPSSPPEAVGSSPDQWVRERYVSAPAERPMATRGVVIDLAAKRDILEVAALMLLVPPMLGWFWLFNFVDGQRRRLG
jgi:hypothetical protein